MSNKRAPSRRTAFAAVVLTLSACTVLLPPNAVAAAGRTGSTSETTIAGNEVSPLLDPRWSDVRRHRAHLDVSGGNVLGAESTVVASVRFMARRGSHAVWCMTRAYSYRPVGAASGGTISFRGGVVHRDGSRDRFKTLVARYSGDPASLGTKSGVSSYSQLGVKKVRAGDVVVFRVKISLDSQVDDLQESIDLTAC